MLKSLYSGVSGMRAQQTKMDVIANNIANVSTTGFKSGRVRFEDMISQINTSAQGASANRGGVNVQQVGMGVQVSGTDTIMTSGTLQATGRTLDLGIQNGENSFFMVRSEEGDGTVHYTRDGGFFRDNNGNLVTATGMRVLGYNEGAPLQIPVADDNKLGKDGTDNDSPLVITEKFYIDAAGKYNPIITKEDMEKIPAGTDPKNIISLESYSIDDSGVIIGSYSGGQSFQLGRIALTSFNNPDGLEKQGGNLYSWTPNSGDAIIGAPGEEGYGMVRSGFLEMSNVDLANEFTDMIVTSRAYQANSRAITTSDEMLQELLNLKR